MLRFFFKRSLQKFASVHASIYNLFNSQRSLYSRINFKLMKLAYRTAIEDRHIVPVETG